MQFSLRTLMAAMLAAFFYLLATLFLSAGTMITIGSWIVQLVAVALVITVVYGQGRLKAFAVGALAGIVVQWIASSADSGTSRFGFDMAMRIGLINRPWVLGGSLFWLTGKAIWIGGCGWLGAYLANHLPQMAPPLPPPVGRREA